MPTATAEQSSFDASSPRPAWHASRRRQWWQALAHAASRPQPAASTTAFRVAFGGLVVFSTVRFVARGWVSEFYLAPRHHLTFSDFAWVRPLPAPLMYAHMGVLVLLGGAIMVGYRTRLAAALFAVGFAYVDLIDAALYLNHYWFVTLAAVVLAVVPEPRDGVVPAVTVWALRGQLAVVYVFAGIAKLNADWLFRAEPMHTWLSARTDRVLLGPWFDEMWLAFAFSWAGAIFDLTIVGWLLWRRSRPLAYVAVVCFHLSTAMLFQIGVFPWVMIALTPVFFAPDWPSTLRRVFRLTPAHPDPDSDADADADTDADAETFCVEERVGWGADFSTQTGGECGGDVCVEEKVGRLADISTQTGTGAANGGRRIGAVTAVALGALVLLNVVLPLRHYAADGNVRFNDDGYYLSWRVMLTERAGFLEYEVVDPSTGRKRIVRPESVLEDWQIAQASTRPDLILATAHLIAADLARQGQPGVEVYANSWVSINGRTRERWIDPHVDLAALHRSVSAAAYVLSVGDGDG